jgi:hypothetical protein
MPTDIEIYKQAIYQLNAQVTAAEWAFFESAFVIEEYPARSFCIEPA